MTEDVILGWRLMADAGRPHDLYPVALVERLIAGPRQPKWALEASSLELKDEKMPGRPRANADVPIPAPMVMVPAGSLPQFEALLGNPSWFREKTALGPVGSPFPERITLADDLRIAANICDHGAVAPILAGIISAPRAPQSPGWSATMAVAPTLGDAIALLVRQLPEANPYLAVALACRNGTARLTACVAAFVPEAVRPLIGMGALFLLYRHMKPFGFSTMREWVLESAAAPAPDLLALQGLMETRLRFGAPAYRLSFPESWLACANPDGDPDLWRLLTRKLSGQRHATHPLAETVRRAMRDALEGGESLPSLSAMAESLGLSERTLVRRLTDAGTSYSRLIDSERRTLAARLITDPAISLQQMADRLAYGDRQGFGRAFRGWFGESPGRYRRRLLSSRTDVA